MAPSTRSRIEWFANLDTTKAPVPTEETKFHRKVRTLSSSLTVCSHAHHVCITQTAIIATIGETTRVLCRSSTRSESSFDLGFVR